jgi:hypothetical protein
VQVRHLRTAGHLAHLVVLVRGRSRGRAHLGHAHELVAGTDRYPQQQVGEGQVGDELPLAGEPVQVLDVGGGEGGVLLNEIAQRGHAA